MKPMFGLCFLVLVSSSVARGQPSATPPAAEDDVSVDQGWNKTAFSLKDGDRNTNQTETDQLLTSQQTLNATENEASVPTASGLTLPASTPTTTPAVTMVTEPEPTEDLRSTSESGSGNKKIKVPSAPTTTSAAAAGGSSKAGYVVLVLIILVILILCIVLFMLRRASRTYSFDLQGVGPSRRPDEPTGTFGQVYVDDLGGRAPKDVETTEDLTTRPAANGTSPGPAVDLTVAPLDQPGAGEEQNSPPSSFGSSLEDDRARETSIEPSGSNLFLQQNENNNNPAVGSSCPFVEINLDEPEWSHQLLTSPPPSSSACASSSS